MMPAVTNTEAANQEKKLSSRVSLVRCLTGLLRGGGGNKGLTVCGHIGFKPASWPPRLTNAVGHPADQRRCGCMDTTSEEKLGKSPERRNYWPGEVSFSDRVSGKDAWYEGAGIYRGGGVSLHGT
jgi:hypothetical protein